MSVKAAEKPKEANESKNELNWKILDSQVGFVLFLSGHTLQVEETTDAPFNVDQKSCPFVLAPDNMKSYFSNMVGAKMKPIEEKDAQKDLGQKILYYKLKKLQNGGK